MVDAPIMVRKEYTVINIADDGFVTLMDESGNLKEDLKLPEDEWLKEVSDRVRSSFEAGTHEVLVIVISAMGQEKIIDVREGKNQ